MCGGSSGDALLECASSSLRVGEAQAEAGGPARWFSHRPYGSINLPDGPLSAAGVSLGATAADEHGYAG